MNRPRQIAKLAAVAMAALVWSQLSSAVSAQSIAGVLIDAKGEMQIKWFADPTGALTKERISAAKLALNRDLASVSKLRKVSLNRLEAALKAQRDNGGQITDEMKNLAGLTRVKYVFYYPETKDIVLAGPAEGWYSDLGGRSVGMQSGRPIVELQDLIVALRMYPPGGKHDKLIGCSIDPTAEGLKSLQEFLRKNRPQSPEVDQQFLTGMKDSLGLQNVSVLGVPPSTHFAQVMVEADYRMKLIGIGLEAAPVKIGSYVDRASPAAVSRNAMQRWYFVPDYKCVRVAEGNDAMELVGDGVKLVNADEVVAADGSRQQGGKADVASKAFVESFTKNYGALADKSPIFAQLRNLIDLAVAAAFIQEQDLYGQAGWKADVLRDEKQVPVQTYEVPVQVETAVAGRRKGNTLMTPIGGGVHVEAREALKSANLLTDEQGKVKKQQQAIDLSKIPAGQWWWD